jgi:hypothetical protein
MACTLTLLGAASTLSAQPDLGWVKSVVSGVGGLVGALIPILIALSFAVFVWGMVQFIAVSGSERAIEEGKRKMLWGVVVLFVITAIWGILALMRSITDTETSNSLNPPTIPQQTT